MGAAGGGVGPGGDSEGGGVRRCKVLAVAGACGDC